MKLIIGLGNPGEKYKNNRHNVGHHFIDLMRELEGIRLFKSESFMNTSGTFVKKIVDYYKVKPENLYIVHDDLDIKLGEYKIHKGRGPQLHGGINSIEETLKTPDFWRVRIGVDNRLSDNRMAGEKYVLEDFTKAEQEIINDVIKKASEELITLVTNH